MSRSLQQVEDLARALKPEERARLAESMLESLRAYAAEDVFAEARNRLR